MAKITNLSQLLNTLTDNQIEELLGNLYGSDYISDIIVKSDDADDAIDELLEYVLSTYQSIDVIDGDTGEVLDTIDFNGSNNRPICITRG